MKNCQHQELVSTNMHTDAAKDMEGLFGVYGGVSLKEKSCFSQNMVRTCQNIVLFEKRLSNHPSWARLFHVCINEIDGWGATSHAKQLHQSLPGHKFEIWEGPSD